MKKMVLLYTGVFALFLSCTKGYVAGDSIKVDFTPKTPNVEFTKIIPLETRDDALIDDFYHMYVTPNYYVAQDKEKIVVFDKSGKIYSTISPIGRGPNEVLILGDVWPDEKSIKVLDVLSNRIVEYGYDGNFQRVIALNKKPTGFSVSNNGFLFDYQTGELDDGNVLAICDESGEIIRTDIGIVAEGLVYGTEKFQKRENYVTYLPSHSNTVYKIDNSRNIDNYYTFDFGIRWADRNTVEKYRNPKDAFAFFQYLQKNDMIGFLKFKEAGDIVSLSFEWKGSSYNWFYNTRNKEQYLVEIGCAERTFAGSNVLAADGNSFIFEIPAMHYSEYPNLPKLPIKETDNPVLLIGNVK
jgi:hypothetical protein